MEVTEEELKGSKTGSYGVKRGEDLSRSWVVGGAEEEWRTAFFLRGEDVV